MTRILLATLFFMALLSTAPVMAQEEAPTIVVGETYSGIVAPFCTTAEEAQRLAHVFENEGMQVGSSQLKEAETCFYFGRELPFRNIKITRLVEKDIPVKDQPEKISVLEIEPADDAAQGYSLFILVTLPVSEGPPK